LNQLDKLIEELKLKYNKNNKSHKSSEYNKISNKLKWMRKKGYNNSKSANYLEYKLLLKDLINTPSINPSRINIEYIRYADDFIIGIQGPKTLAKEILVKIKEFLYVIGLKLNMDKTKITDFYKEPIKFLGYWIKSLEFNSKAKENIIEPNSGRLIKRRKKVRLSIMFDYNKYINKLMEKGFVKSRIRKNTNSKLIYRGTFKGNLINMDQPDIIKHYNSLMRGFYNYYCICRNMNHLANILWLFKESCALTLARKFKFKTMKKVFTRFGKDLAYKILLKNGKNKHFPLFWPENFKKVNIGKWSNNNNLYIKDPFKLLEVNWNNKFTKSNLFKSCILCDSYDNVELHHVRSIATLRDKISKLDFFTRQMQAINRKQVPLCKPHHIKLHNNTLTQTELKKFKEGISKKLKKPS
jgi:hypothetical protein